jgi:hypothetical protein
MTKFLGHLFRRHLHARLVVFASSEDVKRLVGSGDDSFPMLKMELWVLETSLVLF